jgi:c-di-GMP-binding flagellar brake protein YcgR
MVLHGSKNGEVARAEAAEAGTELRDPESQNTLLEVAYPLQQVRLRWHNMDGGEVSVPGQIQSIYGEIVDVWFNRSAPTFTPMHSDDQIWIDTMSGDSTFVFSGWLIGMRPPDTMVILIKGLPRRDQRRQYVRERIDLPPQTLIPIDEDGEPVGPLQEVVLLDLSGGGARIELGSPIPEGCLLKLELDVGGGPFDVILSPVGTYQTVTGRQITRGYFTELSENNRRDVIRFVFREQLRKARLSAL